MGTLYLVVYKNNNKERVFVEDMAGFTASVDPKNPIAIMSEIPGPYAHIHAIRKNSKQIVVVTDNCPIPLDAAKASASLMMDQRSDEFERVWAVEIA